MTPLCLSPVLLLYIGSTAGSIAGSLLYIGSTAGSIAGSVTLYIGVHVK
jgi:hypothetical protein